jgi:uncharacterized protein YndB with AHSA1/START domain
MVVTNQDQGTLEQGEAGQWRIHFTRRLPHPPSQVWPALAEPDQQQRWLPGVTIDVVKGTVIFDFGEDETAEGAVLAAEEGRVLEHTWLWPDEPESTVRWELTPVEDTTTLTLRHEPVRPEPAADYGAGWHTTLDALEVHLAGGDPTDLTPDYDKLYDLYNAD